MKRFYIQRAKDKKQSRHYYNSLADALVFAKRLNKRTKNWFTVLRK